MGQLISPIWPTVATASVDSMNELEGNEGACDGSPMVCLTAQQNATFADHHNPQRRVSKPEGIDWRGCIERANLLPSSQLLLMFVLEVQHSTVPSLAC